MSHPENIVQSPPNFHAVERAIIDYFDTTRVTTLQEASEWFAEIGGRRVSISELALVVSAVKLR